MCVLQVQLIGTFRLLCVEHGHASRQHRINFAITRHHADNKVHLGVLVAGPHERLASLTSYRVVFDVHKLD